MSLERHSLQRYSYMSFVWRHHIYSYWYGLYSLYRLYRATLLPHRCVRGCLRSSVFRGLSCSYPGGVRCYSCLLLCILLLVTCFLS